MNLVKSKSWLTGRYEYRAPLTGLKEIYQMGKIDCNQSKAQKHRYYLLYPLPQERKKNLDKYTEL